MVGNAKSEQLCQFCFSMLDITQSFKNSTLKALANKWQEFQKEVIKTRKIFR